MLDKRYCLLNGNSVTNIFLKSGGNADIDYYLPNNRFLHCMIIAANVYMTVELVANIRGSFEKWGSIAFEAKSAALCDKGNDMQLG